MATDQPVTGSRPAWFTAALFGMIVPAVALVALASGPEAASLAVIGGPVLALGLMGAGMIAAAASGRLWIGVALALLVGAGFLALAKGLGLAGGVPPLATGAAMLIASVSFAVRGALFARSARDKGWWIAVFVVAGEAAILITAAAAPGALPDWLLALLPAQWANRSIQTALGGMGSLAAGSALIALAGTAAATLLVAALWPRRWPYVIMFSTWLALSALVYHYPAPPVGGSL